MVTINKHILSNYFNINEIINIIRYGNGHINDTYLVTTKTEKFILQKVNGEIFNINNLIHNYNYIESYFEKDQARDQLFPKFKKNNDNSIHSFDSLGNAWRVVYFIEDCPNHPISPDIGVSEKAGKTMGRFQLFLEELDPDLFKDTISNFHNPKHRISEFYKALQSAGNEVKQVASKDITFAIENRNIADHISCLLDSNTLPIRVTHNDTKLDNILFDVKNNQNYVIDLDTVMNGSILFDFGDMVRSITSLAIANVREDKLDNFKMESVIKGKVPGLGGKEFKFKVYYLAVMADFATWVPTHAKGDFDLKTFEVRLAPVSKIDGLRPGMTVQLSY